jgi:hypothetical protein
MIGAISFKTKKKKFNMQETMAIAIQIDFLLNNL